MYIIKKSVHMLPKLFGAALYALSTLLDLLIAYVVLTPAYAVLEIVQQHGLHTVNGGGKACFRCAARFKFFPQGAVFVTLLIWKQTEQTVGGSCFTVTLGLIALVVKEICVACVYLHNVVERTVFTALSTSIGSFAYSASIITNRAR